MRLLIGLGIFCAVIFLPACAIPINIQKKCNRIVQVDYQGDSHTTDDYICE